jgi:allantoinase
LFDEEDMERGGALWKCAPPLRSAAEREALWDEVRAGAVDLVASDHSPADGALKTAHSFFEVWGGIAGVQTTLNVLLDAGRRERGMTLPQVSQLLAGGPAARFGLVARMGDVLPGLQADLALVDLEGAFTADRGSLWYRHRDTAYTGRTFRGRVVRTLLRGSTIFHEGKLVGPPQGRLIVP